MAKLSSIACVVSLLAGAGAASATSINVAILSSLPNSDFENDVISKIQPNAQFLNFSVLNVSTSTPSVSLLDQYQAVMVIGSLPFHDPAGLGDNLKEYVDHGHGLVVTALSNTSSNCSDSSVYQLCGSFQTSNYWAIQPGLMKMNDRASLGTIHMDSPILAGVAAGSLGFDGGSISYRVLGNVNSEATRVADWSDGTPFVATRTFESGATEVALNFMPVSGEAYPGLWLTSSEGGLILANAFTQAVGGGIETADVPEPATYLGTAGGLGLLALLLRRRLRTLQCESEQRPRQR